MSKAPAVTSTSTSHHISNPYVASLQLRHRHFTYVTWRAHPPLIQCPVVIILTATQTGPIVRMGKWDTHQRLLASQFVWKRELWRLQYLKTVSWHTAAEHFRLAVSFKYWSNWQVVTPGRPSAGLPIGPNVSCLLEASPKRWYVVSWHI